MWTLSAFADEIDPDLDLQLATLAAEGITRLDLRGVWNKNVLQLTDDDLAHVAATLAAHGTKVSAIGSPIGKVAITDDFTPHLADFRRALAIAQRLDAPFVRIFSFYMPPGDDPHRHRDAVLERVGRLVRETDGTGITLLHENEKHIYGDTPTRCHDLLATINSPILQAVWDPANFVQCGVRPHTEGFHLIRPFIASVHVKDARLGSGDVVPAGQGDGQLRETIAALGATTFDGVFSLEPHLQVAGPSGGFTGPDLFHTAAKAFKDLLRE